MVLVVVGHHLRTTRSGRELYAIGSDPDAARLYGLPVTRRVLTAFVVSGALAGLAGVLYAARYGTVSSGAGLGIELQAVGAAVIGGVAIFGGSGTVWGAAIGAFLLVTINRALPVVGISGLLAAGRGRRADPRRDRARPGPGPAPGTPARRRAGVRTPRRPTATGHPPASSSSARKAHA